LHTGGLDGYACENMLHGNLGRSPARLLVPPSVIAALCIVFLACAEPRNGRDPFEGIWSFWSNATTGTETYCAVERTGDEYLVLVVDLKNPKSARKGTAVRTGKELRVFYPDIQASCFLSLLDDRELRIRMMKKDQAEDVTFVYYRAADLRSAKLPAGGRP